MSTHTPLVISAFFYTEDTISFFCHLLSPSLSAQKFGLDKKQSLGSVYQFSLAASSETASCWLTQHGPRITPTLKISLSHPLSLPHSL